MASLEYNAEQAILQLLEATPSLAERVWADQVKRQENTSGVAYVLNVIDTYNRLREPELRQHIETIISERLGLLGERVPNFVNDLTALIGGTAK